ncbi:MAG: molybdopterin-synthase adenylyltransferase MoeB [Gemmatimonadetes bacterium]|nr:molybdopterin-synthase adenylyltransferase MoeB [Gemmatimonadota bacterium]
MSTVLTPSPPTALSHAELTRYSRHLLLPEVGLEGQRKLKAARVLLIGAGGLGSPAALYLAAAGVGTLGIVDFDVVDVTNLQRQVLHGTSEVGQPKLASAIRRLHDVNPHVTVIPHEVRLTRENALELIGAYDLVVDGTDNFATRYLVNDACVLTGVPNAYGSIFRFDGQVSLFCTPDGPCYRCLYPEPPPAGLVPSCAEGGVLGVLPGMVGTLQATEAIKWILGIGEPLVGRLLLVDALSARWRTVKAPRNPQCPACGTRTLTALPDYDQLCGIRPPQATDQVPSITPRELVARRAQGDDLLLLDVREPHEVLVAAYPDAQLIPLGSLGEAVPSLPRDRDIIVACRSGARSARAVKDLLAAGFYRVWNLDGGILRWSDDVDPSVPKY